MNFPTAIAPNNLLIAIVALLVLALMGAFGGYLFRPLVRPSALLMTLGTILLAAVGFALPNAQQWQLMDRFGILLQLDNLGSYFLLTNGLVTLAVLLYCWASPRTTFFYVQLMVLHVSLNAAFFIYGFNQFIRLFRGGGFIFLFINYLPPPGRQQLDWVALFVCYQHGLVVLFNRGDVGLSGH